MHKPAAFSLTNHSWEHTALAALAALLFAVFVALICYGVAWGSSNSVPMRRASVCGQLGYTTAECADPRWMPTFQPGKRIVGYLTLTSTTDVSEPAVLPAYSGITASALVFTDLGGRVLASKTYAVNEGPALEFLLDGLRDAPCVFPCSAQREKDEEYYGPTEDDLAHSPVMILNSLFWQEADPTLQQAARAYAGATGLPLVTDAVTVKVLDGTGSDAASVDQFRVVIRFAVAKGK